MSGGPHPELTRHLDAARRILAFTGAGISTTSGIPDYRGPQGVWRTRQPVTYPEFLASDEARVRYWEGKLSGRQAFLSARPTRVHRALVDLERAGKVEMVVTQNIDGLHARAGTSGERLVELHGTDLEVECQSCGRRSDPEAAFERFRRHRACPLCECGGPLKPATISFGQSLRPEDLMRAEQAAADADLVIALGSTLSVTPAAEVPLLAARRGVPYIIINRGATEHDALSLVTLRLEGDVEALFPPAVEDALNG